MKTIKIIFTFFLVAFLTHSCLNDLNTEPKVELTIEQLLKEDPNAINGLLSRMYAAYALSSVEGADKKDIGQQNDDSGTTPFIRQLVNLQDFTADGMKNLWGDDGLDPLTTTSNWEGTNKFFRLAYDRLYFIIPQTSNLINILHNGVDVDNEEQIVSELRFLRALAYYYIVDFFGKGVLVNDETFNTELPLPESSRLELFNYAESELLDIESVIASSNEYGRANKACVQMALAKLYMNAEVYTGVSRYDEAAKYINKIINEGGYSLATNFQENFTTDNNNSPEIIFPLIADAVVSQSYGNTTYIINGSMKSETGGMNPPDYGNPGGNDAWGGHRATKAWYGLFGSSATELANSNDARAKLFYTQGHNWEMNDYKVWADGYPSIKFINKTSTGGGSPTKFSSTDFPLFRYSDVLLMYAECALRGAADTDMGQALIWVNKVRDRAGADEIISSGLTLDFILDERARELNLEGHRRQDLIRFGKFTGSAYLWPWKGNSVNGTSIPSYYSLFPISNAARQANPNLTQNPGYN
ncbi:MAG: RagB/SusD family nutrient uptake outer membrane protein [Flavobacteriales bacterium]|nr:RagB/SusD family nutrient uptake outer membrane protein [Flavobacteriales bacterium]